MSKRMYPQVERQGDAVVVTAHTTVEAQQAATDALGCECTVTAVERVHQGGIGGFFATELVRVTAVPSSHTVTRATMAAAHSAAPVAPAPSSGARTAEEMDAVLASADDLVASLRAKVPHFADKLFEEWERGPEAAPADVVPAGPVAAALASALAAHRVDDVDLTTPVAATALPLPPAEEATARRRPDLLRDILDMDAGWLTDLSQGFDRYGVLAETVAPIAPSVRPFVPSTPQMPATPAGREQPASMTAAELFRGRTGSEASDSLYASSFASAAAPVATLPSTRASVALEADWSDAALRSLGLPDKIVDAAMALAPQTEGQWIVALMAVLREYCAPLPIVSSVMVGPASANLARQLKLVSVSADELAESVTSVALPNASVQDLGAGLQGRHVHLVVGGSWQHLVRVPAQVVSAAGSRDLFMALRTAVAWGAVLGWHWAGHRYERIDEFAVVELIRTALRGGEPVSLS